MDVHRTTSRSIAAAGALAIVSTALLAAGSGLAAPDATSGSRHLGFTPWSAAVNVGAPINTIYDESAPALSSDGRSLYFNRNPNNLDPDHPGKVDEDLYVSRRKGPQEPWGEPTPLDILNTLFNDRNATVSRDGRLLFFSSDRTPGRVGGLDLYVSHRLSKKPETWSAPTNLGGLVNTTADEVGPDYVEGKRGTATLYFTSNARGTFDVFLAPVAADGSFGMPVLVQELSGPASDARPAVRADGLEVVFHSNRTPSTGLVDLWAATRATIAAPWGPPVNLGAVLNTTVNDRQAALSDDADMLLFASNRGGGLEDIWMSTRTRVTGD